jgi:flagellar basal body-associated protein FliL
MNDRLREAIAVARSGETREAQLLVAAVLEHSPDNAQAWYLMSHLVESPTRRAAYLYKALSLDPYNERAKAELAQYPSAVTDTLANSIQATSLITVVADEKLDYLPEVAAESEAQNGITDEMPEWLQPIAGENPQRQPIVANTPDMAPPTTTTTGRATTPSPAKSNTQSARPRKRQDGLLMVMVIFLVLVTLIVLGLLVYLLLMQS